MLAAPLLLVALAAASAAAAATAAGIAAPTRAASPITVSASPATLSRLPVDATRVTVKGLASSSSSFSDSPSSSLAGYRVALLWPAPPHGGVPLGSPADTLPVIGWQTLAAAAAGAKAAASQPVAVEVDFQLVFGRTQAYAFVLLEDNGGAGAWVTASPVSNAVAWGPDEAAAASLPSQGRLALTDGVTDGEMRAMWVVGSRAAADASTLTWGRVAAAAAAGGDDVVVVAKNASVKASCYTYAAADMCAAPANESRYFRDPGYICDAVMTGLTSGATYAYSFGTDKYRSPEYRFVQPPAPGSASAAQSSVSVVMYGDLGVAPPFEVAVEHQPPSYRTTQLVMKYLAGLDRSKTHPLVWHIGDISYARGHAFLWEWFSALIEPVATQTPYLVAVGNHEQDWLDQPFRPSWSAYGSDSGGECGVPYSQRFHMPDNGLMSFRQQQRLQQQQQQEEGNNQASLRNQPGKPLRNQYFSVEHGPVHWTTMSTEIDFMPGSPQYEWLRRDLMSVNRSQTPWLIVNGHRPMYSSSWGNPTSGQVQHMRESLEPVFVEAGVDVAFWGHVHKYERTCPVVNFTCTKGAPVHFVVGNAGNVFQTPWAYSDGPNPAWTDSPHASTNHHAHATDDPHREDEDEDDLAKHGVGTHRAQPSWSLFRSGNFGFTTIEISPKQFELTFWGDNDAEAHDHLILTK